MHIYNQIYVYPYRSLGAEIAAACFPCLQPWQIRAVLGITSPVPLNAASTGAMERYLLYLTALFRSCPAGPLTLTLATERSDWLNLSLSLQPAPRERTEEAGAGAGLACPLPPLPSLLPDGLCAATAMEAVALLCGGGAVARGMGGCVAVGGCVGVAARCVGAGFVAAALQACRLFLAAGAAEGGEGSGADSGAEGGRAAEGAAAWDVLLACLGAADSDVQRVAAVRLLWVCAVSEPPTSAGAAAARMAVVLGGQRALVAAALGAELAGAICDLCACV